MALTDNFNIDDYVNGKGGSAAPQQGTGKVPFYNRPIQVPGALRKVLSIGGRFAGPIGVGVGALQVGDLMKNSVEPAVVNAMAGSPLTPDFRKQVSAAGGTDEYVKSIQAKNINAVAPAVAPAAAAVETAAPAAVAGPTPLNSGTEIARVLGGGLNSVPARGTGVIQNNGTGEAAFIDGRSSLGVPRPADYTGRSALGRFFNAGAKERVIANDAKQATSRGKLLIDALTAQSTIGKNDAETGLLAQRAKAVNALQLAGASPAEIAAAAAGRSPGSGGFSVPTGVIVQPGQPIPVLNNRSGTITNQTPRTAAGLAKGSDGKFYITGPDGKAVREATAAEAAQAKK